MLYLVCTTRRLSGNRWFVKSTPDGVELDDLIDVIIYPNGPGSTPATQVDDALEKLLLVENSNIMCVDLSRIG